MCYLDKLKITISTLPIVLVNLAKSHKESRKSANRRSHTMGIGELVKFKSGISVFRCAYCHIKRTMRQLKDDLLSLEYQECWGK